MSYFGAKIFKIQKIGGKFKFFSNDEELIILQGTKPSDTIAIINGKENEEIPPYAVPGITDALRSAQLEGKCLDPDVSQRASYTVTGTTLLSVNIYIYIVLKKNLNFFLGW